MTLTPHMVSGNADGYEWCNTRTRRKLDDIGNNCAVGNAACLISQHAGDNVALVQCITYEIVGNDSRRFSIHFPHISR